jgi:hypothetical protein
MTDFTRDRVERRKSSMAIIIRLSEGIELSGATSQGKITALWVMDWWGRIPLKIAIRRFLKSVRIGRIGDIENPFVVSTQKRLDYVSLLNFACFLKEQFLAKTH